MCIHRGGDCWGLCAFGGGRGNFHSIIDDMVSSPVSEGRRVWTKLFPVASHAPPPPPADRLRGVADDYVVAAVVFPPWLYRTYVYRDAGVLTTNRVVVFFRRLSLWVRRDSNYRTTRKMIQPGTTSERSFSKPWLWRVHAMKVVALLNISSRPFNRRVARRLLYPIPLTDRSDGA